MIRPAQQSVATAQSENSSLAELAQANRVLASVAPVLGHLVANEDIALFSEEIIARTRGMAESLALQLARTVFDSAPRDPARKLSTVLFSQPLLLSHCHALALEAQVTERLGSDAGLDPVLSPLLQDRIAAPQADEAGMAMKLLAAQARFIQNQRRMDLPLGELPADIAHIALAAMTETFGMAAEPKASAIRSTFDEARSRKALLARVVLADGGGIMRALDLDNAGVALFATAVSLASGQDRSSAVLAMTAGQQARLALILSVCGLGARASEAILLRLHPDAPLPRHCFGLARDAAQSLLTASESAR